MPSSSATRNILSRIYGAVIRARNLLYDAGILKIHAVPGVVVVSVGNIEAGGTGKTPLTMALASELSSRGLRTCIVTRGYRGTLKGPVVVERHHTSGEVGDEALLMARTLSVPVIKSPDRVKGALLARVRFGCEVVVLDDAFQHRRIGRDMDIVLVSRDVARERLLPAGALREHASALGRADHTVSMKGAGAQGLSADLRPVSLVNLRGETTDLEALTGARVLAFCAIGSPGHFFGMLERLGAQVERMPFGDHHRFSAGDAVGIMDRAAAKDLVLTTEKDLVKIEPNWFSGIQDRFFAVRVALDMPGLKDIADEIEGIAKTRRVPGQG
ncbi:MAG TPA: tetraacyldisaccharide 4'-kinase [Deltaproteobacteria bacterium]|nr:tetraacyldisaccharide 4'-kinase [Deltaproteobacteria bacterium]